MSEIVKVCKVHGELTVDQIRYDRSGKYTQARCRKCRSKTRKKVYYKDQDLSIKKSVEWKKENREKVNAQIRAARKANPEKFRQREKANRDKDRVKVNQTEIARRLGLKREQYLELLNKQEGKCAICNKEETRKFKDGRIMSLALDHNHTTGKVRGFLCHSCNVGIGNFGDSIELLQKVIIYLKEHDG